MLVINNDDEDANQYWQSLDDPWAKCENQWYDQNMFEWDDNEYVDKYGEVWVT